MPYKILLPIDGSDATARAVRFVIDHACQMPDLEAHLLHVEPRGDDWTVRRMFKPAELAALEQQWAADLLAQPAQDLQTAGMACFLHVLQGEVAPTITQLADALGCQQIIMGTHGGSALNDLLMGSVAIQVLHLAPMPVTFVK